MNSYSTTHLLTRKPLPLLDTSLFIQAVACSHGNKNRHKMNALAYTSFWQNELKLLSYQCNIFKVLNAL